MPTETAFTAIQLKILFNFYCAAFNFLSRNSNADPFVFCFDSRVRSVIITFETIPIEYKYTCIRFYFKLIIMKFLISMYA
jgi:hypothetical protein